ncbi:MAG: 4-alpha-glucanotransferase [Clostridia bacterium]|nr:4-alpha-glucanotransferase [Clostridia bacterium]
MRANGILMPIFSLPSPYGIGTFGAAAYEFVEFLKKAGQSYWQILPLGPVSFGDSPYQTYSSFAGNPYFIDLDLLKSEELLTDDEIRRFTKEGLTVDYGYLYENRLELLKIAFSRFVPDDKYSVFCLENSEWLDNYAVFMTLKNIYNDMPSKDWERTHRYGGKQTVSAIKKEHRQTVNFYKFLQFKFMTQWFALKNYANENGIKIIGDIPIYVAFDSADVWADPTQFLLDEDLLPQAVAGCPPDAFSATGQLWGNPLYNWDNMEKDSYAWWRRRLSFALKLYDIVRIDHFRGFESFYAIPFGSKTAEAGSWVKGPGVQFFRSLERQLGKIPVIAEDLGFLTESVREMLKSSGFPGMKVLQFAFDTREGGDYLPHNYTKNSVVYTGTHDNNTILGWLAEMPAATIKHAKKYLSAGTGKRFADAMIKAAMMSVSDTCILMMPDLLYEDEKGRINIPSTVGGNWVWRAEKNEINDQLAEKLLVLTKLYGRTQKGEKNVYRNSI